MSGGPQAQQHQQYQGAQPGGPQQGTPQQGTPQQGTPQYGTPQYAYGGGPAGGSQATPMSPVNILDTHVTGRRIVQYIIDYAITGIIGGLIMWALDRGTGAVNVILILVATAIDLAWYFWYWVLRPHQHDGQSFGMQLLHLRIISKDGGPASIVQLLIRGVLLIVDTLIWGLVGFITIICSRYRQRVGDHAAKTLVVRAAVEPRPVQHQFAGAGQAGSR
jgi:uncharacterized RDD family membrane protein YckC